MSEQVFFPDGTVIDNWFYEIESPKISQMGKQYLLTDYINANDHKIHTNEIQNLIDYIAESGGGTIVVPTGKFYTGAIFFKQGVNLYIEKGGIIIGSNDISD